MKVVLIAPFPPPLHGQSRVSVDLRDVFEQDGCDLRVVDSTMSRNFNGNKLPSLLSPARFAKAFWRLIRDTCYISFYSADRYYISVGITFRAFMRYAPYMFLAQIKRTPYTIHTHGATLGSEYRSLSPSRQRLMRFFLRRAGAVVVLGESLRGMLDGIVSNDRIFVCPNSYDESLRITTGEYKSKLDSVKQLGESEYHLRLLFLSNIMRAKGVLETIEAFRIIKGRNKNCRIDFAGALEPDAEIEAALKMLENDYPNDVCYRGSVEGNKKRELLIDADILIFPSKNEGQGIVLLEAYATATAIVTDPTVGGIGDVFDSECGESCDHNSPLSIAAAVERASGRLDECLAAANRAAELYNKDMFAEKVKNILLLSKKH